MKENEIRQRIRQALDHEFAHLEPTPAQREQIYENALGGNPMHHFRPRLSFGLIAVILLMLLAVTATAAVLLSAQKVVEETAVPMALENDTPVRIVDKYTPDQVAALIKAANENGITLDETTGIMQALKKGEGYWEDEAIMEICREAFGGIFDEWTIEEQYWYMDVQQQLNHITGHDYLLPDETDMTVEQARAHAAEQLQALYPAADQIADDSIYMRRESFVMDYDDNELPAGPIWHFEYRARDLTHPEYVISFDRQGKVLYSEESPAFLDGPYSASDLVSQIHSATRSRHYLQSDWDQDAWRLFREYLPGANQDPDWGWGREQEAYMLTAYPLPQEGEMTHDQAVALIRDLPENKDASQLYAVLLEYEGTRLWKATAFFTEGVRTVSRRCYEIDSRSGQILNQAEYGTATPVWVNYVPQAVYEQVYGDLLKEDEALSLAADTLRKALQDDTVPFEDPVCFRQDIHFYERLSLWRISFRTKDLRFGTCAVEITEPDRQVTITQLSRPQVDGDTLYNRYTQVYGSLMYAGQDVLIQMSEQLSGLTPTGWKGRLLQKTVYPPLSEAKIPLSDAIDIAARVNGAPVYEELGSCLLGTDNNPVWKFMLDGEDECWVYEVDAVTGEILHRSAYKADDPDFDDPIQRITLRSDYMLAYIEEYGVVRAAYVEAVKDYADMLEDEPELPVLDETLYETSVDGWTVEFIAKEPGLPSYRVIFAPDGIVQTVEKID